MLYSAIRRLFKYYTELSCPPSEVQRLALMLISFLLEVFQDRPSPGTGDLLGAAPHSQAGCAGTETQESGLIHLHRVSTTVHRCLHPGNSLVPISSPAGLARSAARTKAPEVCVQ